LATVSLNQASRETSLMHYLKTFYTIVVVSLYLVSTEGRAVVFGKTAPGEKSPLYQSSAAIVIKNPETTQVHQHCSAVILGPQTLISAAHCFKKTATRDQTLAVRLGHRPLEQPIEEVAIAKVFHESTETNKSDALLALWPPGLTRAHPNKKVHVDLAIVVLQKPITNSWSIPAKINPAQPPARFLGRFAGYGASDIADYSIGGWLQEAILPIKPKQNHPLMKSIKAERAFAPSPCLGDSGGGLFYGQDNTSNLKLIGILITTHPDCTYGRASFENLYYHRRWLKKQLQKTAEWIKDHHRTTK